LIKLFTRLPRPKAFYENIDTIQLNFIPRVDVHRSLSFPSGHTAAAFAMFMMILLYTKNIYIKVAAFLLAVGVSLSRVYLSQHFTRDIAIGALLGIVIALLIQLSFDKFNWYNNLENKMGLLSSIINWKSKQKPTDI
jgi:membrane-associated phospholipid phosphatase